MSKTVRKCFYVMDKGEPIRDALNVALAVKKFSAEAINFVETSNVSKDSKLEVNRVETFTATVFFRQEIHV